MPRANLTAKQALFVQILPTVGFNATEAYKRAGYTCVSDLVAGVCGHRMLKLPKIQAALANVEAKIAQRNNLSQDDVIDSLKRLIGGAEAASQYSAAIRGEELLGKHIGMWPDKEAKELPTGGLSIVLNIGDKQIVVNPRQGNELKS